MTGMATPDDGAVLAIVAMLALWVFCWAGYSEFPQWRSWMLTVCLYNPVFRVWHGY